MRSAEQGLAQYGGSFAAFNGRQRRNIGAATLCDDAASPYAVTTSSFQIDVSEIVLAGARRGDLAALEAIYRHFERPAYALALRMTADREDAREVVHDAMLRLFERIAQFRGDAPFWGWVRQIVVNEALMRLRRTRATPLDDIDDVAEPIYAGPAPWHGVAQRELELALARLPALTRSVIWLYHVEGYTHPEIAEMTGNTVSFSKSQLARGNQRLRLLLNDSPEASYG